MTEKIDLAQIKQGSAATNQALVWNGTDWAPAFVSSGSASSASSLTTARSISLTGDMSWTTTFDGSTNVTGVGTLATVNADVGSFGSAIAVPVITVNAKGLITALSTATLGTAAARNIGTSGTTVPLLDGANTWAAAQVFSGNVSIGGNLSVAGSTFAINSTNLEVSDSIITLAKDNSTGAAGFIGIKAERGSAGNDAYMVWDESSDQFEVQTATGDTQTSAVAVPFQASQFRSTIATGTAPLTIASTTLVANLNADTLDGQHGAYYLNASNFNTGTLLAARMPALTGDVTSAANSAALTLATVNANVGSFGSATAIPIVTVNAKGLVTAVSTAALGTAAQQNTGTSGNTVPLLDGLNTFTNPISTVGSAAQYGAGAQAGFAGDDTNIFLRALNSLTAGISFQSYGGTTNWATMNKDGFAINVPVTIAGTITATNFSGVNTGDQTSVTGNAGTATKLATARTITTTGDITQTVSFDGSANVSAAATLATVNANVGSFGSASAVPIVTVNAKGLITAVATAALGTAAAQNTGTSGASIPLLNTANTWSAAQAFSAKITAAASATGGAGFNLAHGVAPTSPASGDIWTTTSGMFARINTTTKTVAYLDSTITGSAASLTNSRTISASGDLTWSTSFNGAGNATGAATLATVNANVGQWGTAGVIPVLTVNAKGLITGMSTASAPMVGNFPAGSPSSLYAADVRSAANPQTQVGYARGMRLRFGSLNENDTAPWADIIDLSTYADSTGGLINSLYVSKNSFQIQHKQQNGTGGTTWLVKTLAYTDSDITGSAAKLGGQLPSYYTDIAGRLGYTPVNPGTTNSFTGEQVFTNVRISGYGTNQLMQGTGDNATYEMQNTQLQLWWGLGIKSHDNVVRGVIDSRNGTIDMLNGFRHNGALVWSAANHGDNSGLNADLLDSQHGSYYTDIAGRLGYTPANRAGDTFTGRVVVQHADQTQSRLRVSNTTSGSTYALVAGIDNESQGNFSIYDHTRAATRLVMDDNGTFYFRAGGLYVQNSTTGVGLSLSNTNNAGNLGYSYAQFGTHATVSNNWHIGSDGAGNFGFYTGNWGNGVMKLNLGSATSYFNTPLGIGTASPQSMLHVEASPNSDGGLQYQMVVRNNAAITTSPIAGLIFQTVYTTAGAPAGMGGIAVGKLNTTTGDTSSWLGLYTRINGGSVTERLRINHNGWVGIGTATPSAFLDVSNTQQGFAINESFMRLSNAASVGQTPLDFYIAGTFRGRIRADYVGNMSYFTNGGVHAFSVGGEVGTGTNSLTLDTAGRAVFGVAASNHGYIRLVGAGIGEGNIYHDATYAIRMDTSGNVLPICIQGSRLDITSPVSIANSLTVTSNFVTVSNGTWGGIRADTYHGIVMRGDITAANGTVTATDNTTFYDAAGNFTWRRWDGTNLNVVASFNLPAAMSTFNTGMTITGTLTAAGVITGNTSATFASITTRATGTGTNIKVGNNAYIGDISLANGLGIRGVNDATTGYIQFGSAGGQLGTTANGPLRYVVNTNAKDIGYLATANFADTGWTGRIMTQNSTLDLSIFIGNWNLGTAASPVGRAVLAAHNNALNAWAPLYLNTTGIGDGAMVYVTSLTATNLTVGGSNVMRETSAARPGSTKLFRRENDSNFSVQTYWNGNRWVMYGYNGDAEHAGVLVDYANTSGYAADSANTAAISGVALAGLSRGTVANYIDPGFDGGTSKYLRWKNFGNNHTIIDASNATSPTGSAIDNSNSRYGWGVGYPVLVGWNGVDTYGVRVDSARLADSATSATNANSALYFDGAGKADFIRWGGVVANADIDSINTNGFYLVQRNGDSTSILHYNTGGSTAANQIRTSYIGTMEFRNKTDNSAWTSWKRVWTSQDFAAISTNALAASVVQRTGEGYINAVYYNQSSSNSENSTVAQIIVSNGDGYFRKAEMGWFCSQIAGTIKNVAATITGTNNFKSNYDTGPGNSAPLTAYSDNGSGAVMSFHRGGYYAVNFGLDSDNVIRIGGWSASPNRLQLDMSGNLTMAGDITAFSDIRKKKNIATIENGLDKVLAMRGVTYERIEDDKKSSGVIAQELEEIAPELVLTDNDGMKSVAYGNMVGYLIESIKTLEARIRQLEGKQ